MPWTNRYTKDNQLLLKLVQPLLNNLVKDYKAVLPLYADENPLYVLIIKNIMEPKTDQ